MRTGDLTRDHRALKRDVLAQWTRWSKQLHLTYPTWTFEHQWSENESVRDGLYCYATTSATWQYGRVTHTWFLPAISALTPAEREATIVHELCHVLLAPMESHVEDDHTEQCELTVERLARVLLALLPKRGG